MKILTINCGSSSLKFSVFDRDKNLFIGSGIVERINFGNSFISFEPLNKEKITLNSDVKNHKEAFNLVLDMIKNKENGIINDVSEISAVAHRVVHGGEKFVKSVKINSDTIKTFKELYSLAPLHNPPNVMGIEAAMEILPNITHTAIMDTAWHQTMPEHSYIYALPYEWYEKYGIRRYGFHGTSFLYTAKRASVLLNRDPFKTNLIIAHIGNGASINAIKNGVSYDTSMGFTPLEGLVMGTRSGDFDPAIETFMMQKENLSPKDMDSILNKKSGVLGITGKYADRRDIEIAAENGDKRAELAIEIESYRIKKYIGSYAAALGRVDAIVFTAGVGEMSPIIREKALDGLDSFGIKINKEKNNISKTRNAETVISADDSNVKVFVIPTDEERVFVEDTIALLENKYDVHTKFKYIFQSKDYKNSIREENLKKQLLKKPELKKAIAI
ncbi:MAG: acetate kinase [Elusimicrobiales bacterium]|jgi:acetate kinase|nr:acetate kinase [Elusimicrobiales bacterium]NLH38636.1 acetate kinase [Elusimicrobiota bacterium]